MKTPNSITLYSALALLLCYLSYDFITDAKQDFFILNYDWKHSKSQQIGDVKILDYHVNKIVIECQLNYVFDNQKTYLLNNQYYFRAERIERIGHKVSFIGVHWINEYPRILEGIKKISESDLKLIQKKGTTVAMIGDSQMGWREGKYTRKWVSEKLKVHFIGNQNDIFGYPYFFSNNYSSQHLIEENLYIADAKIIILYLGLRESKEKFYSNLRAFITLNEEKQVILIQYSTDENSLDKIIYNNFNNIHTLDLSEYDKTKYYLSDGKHLNYEGHEKLTKDLILKLNSIGVSKN